MSDAISQPIAAALFDACPTAAFVMDSGGRLQAANAALSRQLGIPLDQLVGTRASDLGETMTAFTGNPGEVDAFGPAGEPRRFQVTAVSAGDSEIRFLQDITEQTRLQRERDQLREELKAHALTDPVTGLLNQRGVMLALEPQVARSRRYNSPMSVIMMEATTEQDSDALQVKVARLLKDQLRWADLVGCTDSGEFLMVLPETNQADALKLAEKLAEPMQTLADQHTAPVFPCYGVTEWRKSDNAGGLLRRGASALAEARAERNGVAVAL